VRISATPYISPHFGHGLSFLGFGAFVCFDRMIFAASRSISSSLYPASLKGTFFFPMRGIVLRYFMLQQHVDRTEISMLLQYVKQICEKIYSAMPK
jgi:hypothetical protein